MLGFGALHRLPAPLTEPPHAPGETLFDFTSAEQPSQLFPPTEPGRRRPTPIPPSFATTPPISNFIIPQQTTTSPPPPPKGATARNKFRYAQQRNVSAMDAYMREGELKSQEIDFPVSSGSPRGKSTPPPRGSVPPPPRRQTPLVPPPSS